MKNILISSAGKRVVLVQIFQRTLEKLGLDAKVYASDMNPGMAPACHIADNCFEVPPCSAENYIEELIGICQSHCVGVIIPTIDTELEVLAANRERFEAVGTLLAEPDLEFIRICRDKRLTAKFFPKIGIEFPKMYDKHHLVFPIFAKPYDGSRSINTHAIMDESALTKEIMADPKLIFMEYIDPSEYKEFTVDMYFGMDCKVKGIIPRERVEVCSGEISKGISRKNYIVDFLKKNMNMIDGVRGCICMQLFFRESDQNMKGIEINPRFGGGFPLSFYSGANFAEYIIKEYLLGEKIDYSETWLDNTKMLRYNEDIVIYNADI